MDLKKIVFVTAIILSMANGFSQVRWNLNATNDTLTISGSGAMADYSYGTTPWWSSRTTIKTVIIGDSVTTIGNSAFWGCSDLTSVTIPNSVTTIGNSAFWGCSGLTSVTIPNSVTTIEYNAFNRCSGLTSVTIPNSVTTIGPSAFWGCSGLTSVIIPNSVTTIGYEAFYHCTGLTSVTIPNGVTIIEVDAFSGCTGLTSVTIPNSVTTIHVSAFSGCTGLTSVTIPNSVTIIDDLAFAGCTGLTSVTIPRSVTTIGWAAFSGCTGLTSVTIPRVTTITDMAFSDCTGLASVTNLRLVPVNINANIFQNVSVNSCTLKVFASAVSDYEIAPVWEDFIIVGGYYVNVTANDNLYGYVTGEGIYEQDSTATLTATPNSGYKFVNWTSSAGVVSTANPYIFTVSKDTALVANFEEIPPTITTNTLLNGKVNTVYNAQLTATGTQPITWEVIGKLPNGLSLDTTYGIILGTPTVANTFNFSIKAKNNVGGDTKPFQIVINKGDVSIAAVEKTMLSVYPNPTTGKLTIDNVELTIGSVEIYDLVGRAVFKSPVSQLSQETTIDISHLSAGIYFLKVAGKTVKIMVND